MINIRIDMSNVKVGYGDKKVSNDLNRSITDNNNNSNKNVINSESFKYKTSISITGSTYNVDARITNAEGNEINNPNYDANKSGKKEVEIAVPVKHLISWNCCSIKTSDKLKLLFQ